jgi:hypothetical protein
MANLFDAAYRALAGRTPRLESGSTKDQVAHLERHYGSMAKASRETGIPRTTLRRWKMGMGKPKGNRLTKAVRESLVPPGRRKRVAGSTGPARYGRGETRTTGRGSGSVRGGHGGLTLSASVTVSSDTRDRTMFVGQHIGADVGEQLLNAFLEGDNSRVEEILNAALDAYFGSSSWTLNAVHSVGFDPIR